MVYLYRNSDTGEVKEIVQKMNEKHEYSEGGVQWQRIYTIPQVAIDTNVNGSLAKFQEKSKNQKGTLGDLFDKAKEASDYRAKVNGGVDPVKEKFKNQNAKERMGKQLAGNL